MNMGIFKPGIPIGKTIAKRIKGFPVWEKEPAKKPKKKLTCWILCPDFRVRPPKTVDNEAAKKNYNFSVLIFSDTRGELKEALDHMIRCGYEEIEAGNKRFWLYAVKHSTQHKALFQAELKYIFRVRQLPEEILEEVK